MKGDYNHQNGGNGDLTPGNMFFFAKIFQEMGHYLT